MIAPDLTPLARPIRGLKAMPGNPRKGDVEAVMRSYARFGQRKPIVARRDGTVIAGNHQLKAAKKLGWKEIAVVYVDDDDTTAKAYALADNRVGELGTYDDAALAALIADVSSDVGLLAATGWNLDEIDLAGLQPPADSTANGKIDEVPETAPAITVLGDVWLLGSHQVTCTNSFEVDLPKCDALISDPPYGMGLDTSWYGSGEVGSKFADMGKIEWDAKEFDATRFATAAPTVAMFGANYFCTSLPSPGTWWVWDKRTTSDGGEINFSGGMPFELIWINKKCAHKMVRYLWSGYFREAGTPSSERHNEHPTQKPVAVMREIVEYLTEPGETVLDPFGGSGSTLIACHDSGRVARLLEFNPKYVDVICRRFQQHTGITPIRETTGQPVSFED